MDLIREQEHKDLHKKIYDCGCKPYLKNEYLCKKCKSAILDFVDEYGAGVLTRDIELEELEKKYSRTYKENDSLLNKLKNKIKRVEELKQEVATLNLNKESSE